MSNPWIELDPPHHLDISVIVHDQGIVASKLQQVLAPSVDRKIIKEGTNISQNLSCTAIATDLPTWMPRIRIDQNKYAKPPESTL